MTRRVRISAVQPAISPGGFFETDNQQLRTEALTALEAACQAGADLAGLPELISIFGMPYEEAQRSAEGESLSSLLNASAAIAREHGTYVYIPVLERRGARYFNTVKLFDRRGELIGCYDKTHTTDDEEERYGIVPGAEYPVFTLDFGTVGIMTCMDVNYPEVARILALRGAEIICFPTWQRGPSEISMEIQLRSRAIDNFVHVVRTSYGFKPDIPWTPGMMFGRTCVVGIDGTVLADTGHFEGVARVEIDLDRPKLIDLWAEGGIRNWKLMCMGQRRPETYGALVGENPWPRGRYRIGRSP